MLQEVSNFADDTTLQQQTSFFDSDVSTFAMWLGWARPDGDYHDPNSSNLNFDESNTVKSGWWTSGML